MILGSKAEISYSYNLLGDDRANQAWVALAYIWPISEIKATNF